MASAQVGPLQNPGQPVHDHRTGEDENPRAAVEHRPHHRRRRPAGDEAQRGIDGSPAGPLPGLPLAMPRTHGDSAISLGDPDEPLGGQPLRSRATAWRVGPDQVLEILTGEVTILSGIEASQRHQRAQLRRSLAEDGELISGDRVLIRLEDEHDRADDLPRIRILPMLAAEAKTATDVDLFIVALLDSFGRVLRRRLRDPIGYLESWISIEQPFGDAEKAADGDGDAPETVE